MLSVSSMLNGNDQLKTPPTKRSAALKISHLLCPVNENPPLSTPALSPSTSPSPVSASSVTSPFSPWHDNSYHSSQNVAHSAAENGHASGNTLRQGPESITSDDNDDDVQTDLGPLDPLPLKAKRRRASAKQLEVLNRVFERTFFPSTQLRAELGRQLGMSPRTVQIWFQNRRQAMRTRDRQRRPRQQVPTSPCES